MKNNIFIINSRLYKQKLSAFYIVLFLVGLNSCKKLIEVDPPDTNLNAGNVYLTNATATAAMTGIFTKISNNYLWDLKSNSPTSSSLYLSLTADELSLFNLNDPILRYYYLNDLSSSSTTFLWNNTYDIIFTTNNIIEGLQNSNSLTAEVKEHLLGEAKFMRAFSYFYLVNVYGNVPLVLTVNWKKNVGLQRSTIEEVYQQIIKDLKEAKDELSSDYLNASMIKTSEKTRPNKWTASALLARVYLYNKDYANAEVEATSIINNNTLFGLNTLDKVFLKNSNKEAIWQLQPVRSGNQSNTGSGTLFILPLAGPNTSTNPVYLSINLVNSFEQGDLRKTNWVDSVKPATVAYYFPKKYKIGKVNTSTQEYEMVFRLAEQYLIRAEARAQQNKITESQFDLNMIRNRAALPNTMANDKSSLLEAVMRERKQELFTEWGHRWFDLKRTNTIDDVMSIFAAQKGAGWNSYKALFPIQQSEITLDPQLDQNPGY